MEITISSSENKVFKNLKKLKSRSERKKTGLYIAEGARIVKDAIESKSVDFLVVNEEINEEFDVPVYRFSNALFSKLCDTEHTQGIMAVCRRKEYNIEDISGNNIIVCDGVSDPGNMGTIIRTAECAGFDGVVVLNGCVDVYNEKTVRSTMGSVFRMPIYFADFNSIKCMSGYTFFASVLSDESKDLYSIDFPDKTAIVVGNEANGMSKNMLTFTDEYVKIPMDGKAESLNAAVAAGIMMYHIRYGTR